MTLPGLSPRLALAPKRTEPRRHGRGASCVLAAVAASQLGRSFQVRAADRERCSLEVQLQFERKGFLKVSELLTQERGLQDDGISRDRKVYKCI